MALTFDQLFHHEVIRKVVSELNGPTHRLCMAYGCNPGGSNVIDIGGRDFAWDTYNHSRGTLQGRAPSSGPSRSQLQVAGKVQQSAYRIYDEKVVDLNRLFRKRAIGEPLGTVDTRGAAYIGRQQATHAEQATNTRELLLAWAMTDGGFEIKIDGDTRTPLPLGSGGDIVVDFQHPVVNRGTVEGIFDGDWNVASSKILKNLLELRDHAANNSRYTMTRAWCRSETLYHIMTNDEIKSAGGTANTVFNTFQWTGTTSNPEGALSSQTSLVLRGDPNMLWNTYDDHVVLPNGQIENFLQPGEVLFTPGGNTGFMEWFAGSELIQKRINGPREEVFGFNMWMEEERKPPRDLLVVLDNGLPAFYAPGAWYVATVY